MRKYFTICFLILEFSLFGQQNSNIFQQSTYYFSLDSMGTFNGYGADFIKNKIAESQFFLIGEQHDIHSIETLVNALIPHFKKSGYNHYVTEIGPISAKKLIELKQNSSSLKSYYSKYMSQTNLQPFGFFSTEEEEQTLKQLTKYQINLWGIDFENYASYLFLIDEIYENADKQKVSNRLYHKVYSIIEAEYQKGNDDFNPQLMSQLLQSDDVSRFLHLAENKKNIPLIEQFKLSLKINHQQTMGFWEDRVENMKTNFIEYYHFYSLQEDSVKAFIKLGAVHTARGISYSGNAEIGNMIYELANVNQSKSFSLITFPRYILNDKTKEVEDLIDREDKEILQYVFPNQWSIIDLMKLKELSLLNRIELSKNTLSYIEKYDAIVIPPTTKYSKKIE